MLGNVLVNVQHQSSKNCGSIFLLVSVSDFWSFLDFYLYSSCLRHEGFFRLQLNHKLQTEAAACDSAKKET